MSYRSRVLVNKFLNEYTHNLIKNGFLAVYKRPNLTSVEELEDLKSAIVHGMEDDEAVKEKKFLLRAGHGGNLDSMATGVLGVGLCDGCKVLSALLSSSKRYIVTGCLGAATDTYNSMGSVVVESSYNHVTKAMLEKALKEFEGEIWQTPPAYSALKIGGQRSSDLVRSGKEVKMVPRPVVCHSARCVSFEPPYFTIDVSCGQGFYVRSLIHDLAEAVGSCAHVTALCRTKHGPFTFEDCLHPENYSRENIITAVEETRRKFPELAQHISNYFRKKEEKFQKNKINGQYKRHKQDDDLLSDSSLADRSLDERYF